MGKFIFVSGGVCSGLGKGLTAASIGTLLEIHGHTVHMIKIDPYINLDAGTMSPLQHGEVFVTDDGTETDLDLGNYSRFTNTILGKDNSITTGKIYHEIIQRERKGDFLGKTVQVVPHITNAIKDKIYHFSHDNESITIVEIGGTVGDIESFPFLEAVRQVIHEKKDSQEMHCLMIHLVMLPLLKDNEYKTKPSQHSVKALLHNGINPNILVCRCPYEIPNSVRQKLSLFTSIDEAHIFVNPDLASIYTLPAKLKEQSLDTLILKKLNLKSKFNINLNKRWNELLNKINNCNQRIIIGLIGKYTSLPDAYKSIYESLYHGGLAHHTHIEIKTYEINNQDLSDLKKFINSVHAVIIPGGFDKRGSDIFIQAFPIIKEAKLPVLAICLGAQCMAISHARYILKEKNASSTEIDPDTSFPIISLRSEQNLSQLGGSMRLGSNQIHIKSHTLLRAIYSTDLIQERHRHRYEINKKYRTLCEESGLIFSAFSDNEENYVEAIEWANYPFAIGVQFHPEFKSSPISPHPLFKAFIYAAHQYIQNNK